MNAQVASDHFYSTVLLTKWKVGVIKPWNCNYPLGTAQQLCFRMFPIWIQCFLQQRREAAVQMSLCVYRATDWHLQRSLHCVIFKRENLTSDFFIKLVYILYVAFCCYIQKLQIIKNRNFRSSVRFHAINYVTRYRSEFQFKKLVSHISLSLTTEKSTAFSFVSFSCREKISLNRGMSYKGVGLEKINL